VATLHVRNVPDLLYEALRANAAVEGRSIGAQTVELLSRALEVRADPRAHVRERFSAASGYMRFRRDARSAIVSAQDEVRALGHGQVATEHLLLGLMRSHEGPAAWTLEGPPLGITFDRARERVIELRGRGEGPPTGAIPFTAGAKQALELALREALAQKLRHIAAHHVLLGIAGVDDDLGAQVLRDLGADPDTLRAVVLQKLAGAQPPFFVGPPPDAERELEYQAVALTGAAEEWTGTLNGLAAEGWELASIVSEGAEPRAVFRRPVTETE
jgi:plasmid stability protein